MKFPYEIELTISDLDHKGYGLAVDAEGRKYAILNSLPDEVVVAEIYKKKKQTRYGKAINIIKPSPFRVPSIDTCYLETSPWEIMDFIYENDIKKQKLVNLIAQPYPVFNKIDYFNNSTEYEYRNKMEFSFYFDEDNKINIGFHKRDSKRGKVKVESIHLMPDNLNELLRSFLMYLNEQSFDHKSLKGLTVRYSFLEKKAILVLFVRDENFPIEIIKSFTDRSNVLKSFFLMYSDFKSPAFVETKPLLKTGELELSEHINGKKFIYPYNSFFQVNPDIFAEVVKDLRGFLSSIPERKAIKVGEFYAGVGTIGISIADLVESIDAVEISTQSKEYSQKNAEINGIKNFSLIEEKAENIADSVKNYEIVIFDPPRSGIHEKLIDSIRANKPKYIIYLSCNPITQIENLDKIKDLYSLKFYKGYNFYPKTPHMEALAILELKY
jgi:23S rRNA (uracil1939-C5)-methyltransferase